MSRTAMTPRIEPSGDQCLIVEFGSTIDVEVNRRVCAFARRLQEAALAGVLDIVPSYTALGVHYRAAAIVRRGGETPFAALSRAVEALLAEPLQADDEPSRLVEIPVCYGGEFGPDLEDVAAATGLPIDEVVRLHGATIGRVFMLGFAPGHPFIGVWDEQLAVPRRPTPRTRVPAGSVAIANRQSNVYPFDLPGGWNVIGRTPLTMFDPRREPPCLLRAGDSVRFVPITRAQFDALDGAPR
jgi:KipI family sensor histidine kinase inhibitor